MVVDVGASYLWVVRIIEWLLHLEVLLVLKLLDSNLLVITWTEMYLLRFDMNNITLPVVSLLNQVGLLLRYDRLTPIEALAMLVSIRLGCSRVIDVGWLGVSILHLHLGRGGSL